MNATLSLRGVTLRYGGPTDGLPVLSGIDLDIVPGESVAVMGPSGSGKSTLLHVAAGLRRPDAGVVTVAGQDIGSLSDSRVSQIRGRRLGFVFQAFHLLPHLTALENVAVPLWIARERSGTSRHRAMEALRRVGLATRATHRPAQLSGGEKQRVAIARAIVARPELILADEPTGNLDLAATAAIASLLASLTDSGAALLVATHDSQVAGTADRVLHLA